MERKKMACDPCKQKIILLRTSLYKLNKKETLYKEPGTKPMTQ